MIYDRMTLEETVATGNLPCAGCGKRRKVTDKCDDACIGPCLLAWGLIKAAHVQQCDAQIARSVGRSWLQRDDGRVHPVAERIAVLIERRAGIASPSDKGEDE